MSKEERQEEGKGRGYGRRGEKKIKGSEDEEKRGRGDTWRSCLY